MSKLSENLKKIRKDNNFSQEDLAEKLGVSRQAISKWESDLAYPEMDKIIQIAKMFNLNIDDLLKNDIRESKNEKEKKNSINKCIDDFLNFISDTTKMFSRMTFGSKIKCLIKMLLIICFLCLLGFGLKIVLNGIFEKTIYYFFPYEWLIGSFDALYLTAVIVLIVIITIHIFKTQYLDYFKDDPTYTEKTEKDVNTKEEIKEDKNRNEEKKYKNEKIIIRNPKHSEYKFINALFKYIVFLLKVFILGMSAFICIPLIISIIILVLSFAFIKTGLLFIGILIAIIACGTFLTIILLALLNFVLNRKSNKKIMIYVVIISMISFGLGCGLFIISLINFNYIDVKDSLVYEKSEIVVPMDNQMFINDHYGEKINYKEENRNDIRLEFYNNKYCDVELREYGNGEYALFDDCFNNFKMFSDYIKDINNKKIYELDTTVYDVTIYTSKENIEILKNNLQKYNNANDQQIEYYEGRISELETSINEYQGKITELEISINGYQSKINELQNKLDLYEAQHPNDELINN